MISRSYDQEEGEKEKIKIPREERRVWLKGEAYRHSVIFPLFIELNYAFEPLPPPSSRYLSSIKLIILLRRYYEEKEERAIGSDHRETVIEIHRPVLPSPVLFSSCIYTKWIIKTCTYPTHLLIKIEN